MKKFLPAFLGILFSLFSLSLYADNQVSVNNIYGYDFSKIVDKNSEIIVGDISKSDCGGICLENTLNATFINSFTGGTNIEIFKNLKTKSFSGVDETFLSQRNDKLYNAVNTYKGIINGSININSLENSSGSVSVMGNLFAKQTVISPKILKTSNGDIVGIGYFSYSSQDISLPNEYYYNIVFLSKDGDKYIEIRKEILKTSDIFNQKVISKVNNLVGKNDKLFSQVIITLNKYVSTNKKISNSVDELIKNINL